MGVVGSRWESLGDVGRHKQRVLERAGVVGSHPGLSIRSRWESWKWWKYRGSGGSILPSLSLITLGFVGSHHILTPGVTFRGGSNVGVELSDEWPVYLVLPIQQHI